MLTYKAAYQFVEGGVHATLLDFPGAITCGADLAEARRLLASALIDWPTCASIAASHCRFLTRPHGPGRRHRGAASPAPSCQHGRRADPGWRGRPVKRRDLIRHLTPNGCVLAREGADHSIWENPANGRRTAVPRHREIPTSRHARSVASSEFRTHSGRQLPVRFEGPPQERRCAAPGRIGNLPGRAGGDDLASFVAGSWADVDDPVACGDDLHLVLDDDHGVARLDQAVELGHELVDVRGVQAGGGLVEDVERVAALGTLEFGGELDPLGLASGKLGRGLAEPEVTRPTSRRTVKGRSTWGSSAKKAHAASIVMRRTSAMLRSRYLIARVSSL